MSDDLDLVMRHEETAHLVGLGYVWDAIAAQEPTASRDMLLGILAALAQYMDESAISLTPTSDRTPAVAGG